MSDRACCLHCHRPVNCSEEAYCYRGLGPPPKKQQTEHPGFTLLLVCNSRSESAMTERTEFVCRKRVPSTPVTHTPVPPRNRDEGK